MLCLCIKLKLVNIREKNGQRAKLPNIYIHLRYSFFLDPFRITTPTTTSTTTPKPTERRNVSPNGISCFAVSVKFIFKDSRVQLCKHISDIAKPRVRISVHIQQSKV